MRRFAPLVLLVLAACATDGVQPNLNVITKTVVIPTPVPCKPALGPEPNYPTTAQIVAAPNIAERAKLYAADRQMRIARAAEMTAALKGCASIPVGAPGGQE